MNDELTTDHILDIYNHLEKSNKTMPELLADHGITNLHMTRAANVLVSKSDESQAAFSIGLAIGLQLGAMRLDPIEFVAESEDNTKSTCNCLMCSLQRIAEEIKDAEDTED